MAEQDKPTVTWNVVLPMGALGLLGTLMLVVAKDASVGLDLARQHGEQLLLMNNKLHLIEQEMKERTALRYTSEEATRDYAYYNRELERIRKALNEHIDDIQDHAQ